jgi:hypothetical protein
MLCRQITVISIENHTRVTVVGIETTALINLRLCSGITAAKYSSGRILK